jgi:peptidoglycan/xylan/chitin deacetylase (PgdA/CDA1 family)
MNGPLRVPILTYHSVDASGSVLSVDPADFRAHVESLRRNGFMAVGLDRLVAAFEGRTALPAKPVVLTFDDAYSNFLEQAAGPLCDAGFSATVFVIAGLVGKWNGWERQASSIPRMPLLDWAQLREVASLGFEIGSHGLTHTRLDRLAPEALHEEIASSKHALEDGIGTAVRTFAYPFGIHHRPSVAAAAGYYSAACTTRMATARASHPRHLLPRLDVYYVRSPRVFAHLGKPLGRAYLATRTLGRAVRTLAPS